LAAFSHLLVTLKPKKPTLGGFFIALQSVRCKAC